MDSQFSRQCNFDLAPLTCITGLLAVQREHSEVAHLAWHDYSTAEQQARETIIETGVPIDVHKFLADIGKLYELVTVTSLR